MLRKRRKSEGFNLAFLDIMSCGLGAVVLVFMLVKHNVGNVPVETDLLTADVKRLELQQQELHQTSEQLQSISQPEVERVAQLQAKRILLEQTLSEKESSLKRKKPHWQN